MTDQGLAYTSRAENGVIVDCLHSVLRQIGELASENEISGILLGTREEGSVRILAFRRLVPKRSFTRAATLSDTEREAVARLIAGPPAEGELYGLEPVGWFRAQPRRELDLSPWELQLLNEFFTDSPQVGMALRPASAGPTRARFYVREPNGFLASVHRNLIVPVVPGGPMLTVEAEPPRPETPRPDPLASEIDLPAPHPRDRRRDLEDEEPEGRRGVPRQWGALVWRTVSSLVIAAFVLGYWWTSPSREAANRAKAERSIVAGDVRQSPRAPAAGSLDLAAKAPPEQPPDTKSVDDLLRGDEHVPSAKEIAELTKDLKPARDLAPLDEERTGRPKADRDAARTEPPPPPSKETRALRPLRFTTPPRKNVMTAELAAPPVLARETPAAVFPALPQSLTVVPPARTPPPRTAAAPAPANGSLIWTGRLRKNSTVIIDGKTASLGTLTGELPGRPVQFRVYPGDLGDDGILVFTARPQDARNGWDSPGPQNGWNRIVYEFDPHNAAGVEVEEAPGPGNAWKRLVLRCTNPKLSVIYVKWSAQ